MKLPDVLALLLAIRDREPFIPRIDPADGRVVLFLPDLPVSKPGLIRAWLLGEGGLEVDWTYFYNTAVPTPEDEPDVRGAVDFHYASYPERVGLRLDRDASALRLLREKA